MNTRNIIIAALMLGTTMAATAQTNEQINESRRQYYNNYGRVSMGVNAGTSAIFGDFSTFSKDKYYVAPIVSAFVSYQFTPTIGFTLEGYYSWNKAGATSGNKDQYLNFNGFKAEGAYNELLDETYLQYGDLYSKVDLWQGRLGVDINVNNIFGGNKGGQYRKWTVIFSPSYYLQYYRPKVYKKNDDKRYTKRDLFYQVNSGVGAELALRYRMSRLVDLQLKGGGVYGFNKKFEGIAGDKKNNILAYAQVGVVFKLNGKTKRDNLLYAATPKYVPTLDFGTKQETVHDTVVITKEVVKEIVKEVSAPTWIPAVHFVRGKSILNDVDYGAELSAIIEYLNQNPTAKFEILGWADHTGDDNINVSLTQERAEALAQYLTNHGIDTSRIVSIKGMGKDMSLTGAAALSSQARRAEVKMQ